MGLKLCSALIMHKAAGSATRCIVSAALLTRWSKCDPPHLAFDSPMRNFTSSLSYYQGQDSTQVSGVAAKGDCISAP